MSLRNILPSSGRRLRQRAMGLPSSGFTLTEIMVSVAITGVMSAIAIPTYSKYFKQAKTAEIYLGLASIYNMEQAHYTSHGWYTTNLYKLFDGQLLDRQSTYAVYGFNPSAVSSDPTCYSGNMADCATSAAMNTPKNVVATSIKYPKACVKGMTDLCTSLKTTYNPRNGPPIASDFTAGPPIKFEITAVMDLEGDGTFDVYGMNADARALEGNSGFNSSKTVYRMCDNGTPDANGIGGFGAGVCNQ